MIKPMINIRQWYHSNLGLNQSWASQVKPSQIKSSESSQVKSSQVKSSQASQVKSSESSQVKSDQVKSSESSQVKKSSLPSSSKQSYPAGHQRQQQLHDAIVQNLMIELGLPLSLVERPEFIKFISAVAPKFSITSRRTLRRTTIPNLYNKMNDLLKQFCSTAQYISLTLDIWSDRRARSFFSITGHAIIDTQFKSYVLCFLPLNESHSSEKLLGHYELIINEFQIQNKLCRIITDNASNNIKAFEDLIIPGFESYFYGEDENYNDSNLSDSNDSGDDSYDNSTMPVTTTTQETLNIVKDSFDNLASSSELRLPCFAHTLQLVVKDGLEEAICIKQIIAKVSKIAKLAHSSTIFAENLEAIGAIQKVLEIPSAQLNLMLTELKRKDLCLGTRDTTMLHEFVSLLVLIGEATTVTQAQNSPSISLVGPSIISIYYDLINEQNNITFTTTLCNALLSSLVARFGGLFKALNIEIDSTIHKKGTYDLYGDPIFLVAAFLDAKFKLKWITESSLSEEKKIDACAKIKSLVFDHCVVLRNVVPDVNVAVTQDETIEIISDSRIKRKGLFSYLENDIKKRKVIDPFQYIHDEISLFAEDVDNDSLLVFRKSSIYKTLSRLAVKVLCVSATSAPVERVFSQSGFLMRQHRASMSNTTLQMLTMLKCNSHLQ
ncbi:unnamed protein product [Rotaria socialis]|uniref:HAT C-terminal dimerisation domain-containing protein n=1 Tax=Rotaria socialis TaxID=392032 RepID=A0A817SUE5_9BILA|nr:unnamed protein product [Rotaria socialis]